MGIRCNETSQEEKSVGGRPRATDKVTARTVGIVASLWGYVELWDGANISQKLTNALECLRLFAPEGYDFNRPRDSKGRFLPIGGEREAARRQRMRRKEEEDATR